MAALALLITLTAGLFYFGQWVNHGVDRGTAPGRELVCMRRAHAILRSADLVLYQAGSYPTNLADLANATDRSSPTATVIPEWARDPFAVPAAAFGYSVSTTSPRQVTLTSLGPDGLAGTADDGSFRVSEAATGRGRTRPRQRVLNSAYLNSPLLGHGTVSLATRLEFARQLRLRRQAEAARHGATTSAAASWAAIRDAADAELTRIRQVNGLTGTIPTRAIGSGGMLSTVGRPDTLGFDAFGTEWLVGIAGFRSAGGDRTEGGDDDL